MFSLTNKSAIITGGGSGIGKAIAELFAANGAYVSILDLNESAAVDAEEVIRQKGGKVRSYACNVTQQDQVAAVMKDIMIEGNRIDILVNSAGIASVGNVENTSADEFDRVFEVNVKGIYNTMQAAVGYMKANGGGCILNIASIAASIGISDRFAYSMSKGAVVSMTMSVAKDYLKDNIRCNCLSPARVHTSFVDGFIADNFPGQEKEMLDKLSKSQPIGRMGKPEEVAALALYLCSEEASFITGCDYPFDGGFIKLSSS